MNAGSRIEAFISDRPYVDDPKIHSVKSGRAGQAGMRNGPRGIPSGGIVITVDGTNFNVIKDPKMYVVYKEKEFSSPCEVKNSTRMECRSPAISVSASERIDHENGMLLDYGFLMDHVKTVRNLNKFPDFPAFRVFPDPLYHPFEDTNSSEITVFAHIEERGVPHTHPEEAEIRHTNLTSGIEATEILLRIVEQKISKYRKYQWMLLSLKSELMHEEGQPGTTNVTHSVVYT
uniref:IPT/TIG domain-containing protein n=1 Tax=Scylla olivacea TaxID=85551 RepID=A0A0P4VV80_SCYOL